MLLEFAQIRLHPGHDLVVVLRRDGGIVHIPQGQLLGQYLKERRVLVGHDGLVYTAVGKGAGGDQLALIQLCQRRHAVVQTVGEDQTLHLVILLDAVVAPGGVQHPVADVHQIQQTPELLLRHFQLHHTTSVAMGTSFSRL